MPSQVRKKNCYSLGRVTKNDMMAPKPQSDPIIATVGQRSARLLVSTRMQTEAITTRAAIAMYAVLALGRLTVSFSGKSRIDGADCSTPITVPRFARRQGGFRPSPAAPCSRKRTRRSARGNRIVNVSPLFCSLSMMTSPPWARTMRRTMSSPRPEPTAFVVK